jgi:hypothetical protein
LGARWESSRGDGGMDVCMYVCIEKKSGDSWIYRWMEMNEEREINEMSVLAA